jgi:hypothetical protein
VLYKVHNVYNMYIRRVKLWTLKYINTNLCVLWIVTLRINYIMVDYLNEGFGLVGLFKVVLQKIL